MQAYYILYFFVQSITVAGTCNFISNKAVVDSNFAPSALVSQVRFNKHT